MARDRYKYFRIEAADLVERLASGLAAMQHGDEHPGSVRDLLRVAHTLKGAAHVVKHEAIATAAHRLEDALAAWTEADHVPPDRVPAMLAITDHLSSELGSITTPEVEAQPPAQSSAEPAPPQPPASAPVEAEETATVRVYVDEINRLMQSVEEMTLRVSELTQKLAGLDRAATLSNALVSFLMRRQPERGRALRIADPSISLAQELREQVVGAERAASSQLERLQRELVMARELTGQLRLVPTRALFVPLERAVRTAGESLGKKVRFVMTGGDLRIDSQVVGALRDALIHVVRNAVAHGIEPPDERRAVGKPPIGTVELAIERRGRHVAFICNDDGRGMNVDAIRRTAIERRILTPEQARQLPDEDVLNLILQPGFTTEATVGTVAGRGIGLDVLRDTVARLRGHVRIVSQPSAGARIEAVVSTSLLTASAVVVQAGGLLASMPIDHVQSTVGIRSKDIVQTGKGESLVIDSQPVPYARLSDVLQEAGLHNQGGHAALALVVRHGQRRAAIGVDRLIGISNIVLRSLPAFVAVPAFVAGATLDASGNPQLVLDPQALVDRASSMDHRRWAAPEQHRLPLLVIDDSLTTRMLEQSILESAGYQVDTATSAEEALQKARNTRYGLFLVDVEMPGLDGFQFIEATRQDASLQHVPAILVTSRSSPEDREHGTRAGASDYVVKSEFDQGYLLERIRQLALTQ